MMQKDPVTALERADYGIDVPTLKRNLILVGVGAITLGIAGYHLLLRVQPVVAAVWLGAGMVVGGYSLLHAVLSTWSSMVGKIKEADRLLNTYDWRGDEIVLDIGCGRGLHLIEAAKRLTTGKAIGVDIWEDEYQGGNKPENTWANARIEQVADRIELKDGDVRKLPFDDETFDVVVSSMVLHNVENRPERKDAIREIVRVLKPGGYVAILDFVNTGEYFRTLQDMGWHDIKLSRVRLYMWPPVRWVTGTKPV